MTACDPRGGVDAVLSGRTVRLRLTLGALAEIEAGLGLTSLDALPERLGRLNAGDAALVLRALIRGGGGRDDHFDPVEASPGEAAAAIASAIRAGVGAIDPPGKASPSTLG